MDKKILIATDGSEFSEGAVREAINIAKTCGIELYSMSVVEINTEFLALVPTLVEKREREIRTYLERIKDRATKENVKSEMKIREGEEPYKLIVEEADKKQAGLIVMGRRGRKGLMRLLMGSATARVIGHTSRNVLVVPRASDIKWKNIVIATDGSKYSEAAAREAMNLIKNCCSTCTLNIIAVVRPDATKKRIQVSENGIKKIKSDAEKEDIKVNASLIKGKPHENIYKEIVGFAKKKDADIIVMGSHGRTGLQKLLMGSVTERVIGHTDRAVMVVKG